MDPHETTVTGYDIVNSSKHITKDRLFHLVVTGQLVPYEPFKRIVHPSFEPYGMRRFFPHEDQARAYEEMVKAAVQIEELETRLKWTADEYIKNRHFFEFGTWEEESYRHFEATQGAALAEELQAGKASIKQKIETLREDVRSIEDRVHPSVAWADLVLDRLDKEILVERFLSADYLPLDVEAVTNAGANDSMPMEMKQRALSMFGEAQEFYDTLKRAGVFREHIDSPEVQCKRALHLLHTERERFQSTKAKHLGNGMFSFPDDKRRRRFILMLVAQVIGYKHYTHLEPILFPQSRQRTDNG